MSLVLIVVSDQVQKKLGCAVTDDGLRLEILDLGSRGIILPCMENKGADQLCGYRTTDLRLCFRICKTLVFSKRGSNHFCIQLSKHCWAQSFRLQRPLCLQANSNRNLCNLYSSCVFKYIFMGNQSMQSQISPSWEALWICIFAHINLFWLNFRAIAAKLPFFPKFRNLCS